MTMPSFKDFVDVKNPAMAILYVAFFAIGSLYVRSEMSNQRQFKRLELAIKGKDDKIDRLEANVGFLTEQMRRRDSAYASLSTRLDVLKELGKIQ